MSLNIVFYQDKKTYRRIIQLIEAIQRDSFTGIGKPEPLRGSAFRGYWSRRIDDCNRIVYKTDNQNPYLVQLRGHYND